MEKKQTRVSKGNEQVSYGANKFYKDLKMGQSVEEEVLQWCLPHDNNTRFAPPKTKGFDIVLPTLDKTIEVKYDKYSKSSGNIAIEYSYKNQPSGIQSTTADAWVIKLWNEDWEFWSFKTKDLTKLCKTCRRIGGGDGMASMMFLVPVASAILIGTKLNMPI